MTDAITEPLPARSAADVSSGDRRVLLITGMSGAGKTSALKALEDLGYEAIDHVPLSLLKRLVPSPGSVERPIAIGVDVRTRDFGVERFIEEVDHLAGMDPPDVRVAFLDCEDDELRRRYTETRHRHPLAEDRTVADGIAREREMLTSLRSRADVTIDTSNLAGGELKRILDGHFGLLAEAALSVFVTSFAYRNGLPREADLVFDVRFLANPHYDPALRPMTGREEPIAAYVAADPGFSPFFDGLTGLLTPLLPRYAAEGKSYLTIAVGCTGGRHRSVFTAERLAAWLETQGLDVHIHHRELERPSP